MKRIFLFILTNLAIVLVLGVVTSLLGVNRYLTAEGINYEALLGFCLVFGFGGAFISLLLSKPVAKWMMRARVIEAPRNEQETWLLERVAHLAQRAGISTPEVAIYDGEPNAFATGAFRDSALVAVSTGLLARMDRAQVEAVLAHEVAHVANGDMVTMTLLQGVLNVFVMFLARVVGYAVDRGLLKNEESGPGVGYYVTVVVLELFFGLAAALIVAAFSRHREYRADAGAATLLGQPNSMISALRQLAVLSESEMPKNLAAFGIAGGAKGWLSLFATHPAIEARIAALEGQARA